MARRSLREWSRYSLLGKFSETLGTRFFVLALGLVFGIAVARLLLPEGRGLLAVAVTLQAIGVQLGHLGMHTANTLFVARDSKTLPQVFSNTLVISVLFGAAAALFVGGWFVFFSEETSLDAALLGASLGSIPLGIGFLLVRNLLLALDQVHVFNRIEATIAVSNLLALGCLLLFGAVTPITVFAVSIGTSVLGTGLAIGRLRKVGKLLVAPDLGLFLEQFRFAYRSYLSCVFSYLVLRFDILLIRHYGGAEEVGWYAITSNYADKLLLVPGTLGLVLFPKLASIVSAQGRWDQTRRVLGPFTLVMLALTVVACAACYPIVRYLYGVEYLPAVAAFLFLSPGIVALALSSLYMNHFAASGMPFVVVYGPLSGFAANIVLNVVLIPQMSINGAALASTISYGLVLSIALLYERLRDRKRREPTEPGTPPGTDGPAEHPRANSLE